MSSTQSSLPAMDNMDLSVLRFSELLTRLRTHGGTFSEYQVLLSQQCKSRNLSSIDTDAVFAALEFAEYCHRNQTRADGLPYIVHPMRVAALYIETPDAFPTGDGIVAALFHDLLEDCPVTRDELASRSNEHVVSIVECLTARRPAQETTVERRERKLRKWRAVRAADRTTRLVHIADVIDNLVATRHLPPSAEQAVKVSRWLMQAQRYHVPIAFESSKLLAETIEEELIFEDARGYSIGTWEDQ